MRRIINRSGQDSDEDVEVVKTEEPEPAAEWTEEDQEGTNTMTTVNMQIV